MVAVDGASGTGKSTLADELARTLEAAGHVALRASIDSFHRPRAERYRLGPDSPEGYYLDSHDLHALRAELLDPFAEGHSSCRLAVFDEPSDLPLPTEETPVSDQAVLVFDGLFLHRPELIDHWDLSLYLRAEGQREAAWQAYLTEDLPSHPAARAAEVKRRMGRARRARYVDGQALYEREAQPLTHAHVVIDNDDLARPRIVGRRPARRPTGRA